MHSPCHQHSRLFLSLFPLTVLLKSQTDLRVSSESVDGDRVSVHSPFIRLNIRVQKGCDNFRKARLGMMKVSCGNGAVKIARLTTTRKSKCEETVEPKNDKHDSISLRFQFANQLKLKCFYIKSPPLPPNDTLGPSSNANHGLNNNSTQGSRPSPDQRIAALGLLPFTDRQSMHWLQHAGVNIGQRLPLNRAEMPPWRWCRHANCNLFE